MGVFSSEHPFTAITATINQLVSLDDEDFEPEAELPGLLESIKIQPSGPTEAARAIRKKLKYGTPDEQLKALNVLELLVSNGGRALNPLYSDYKLIDNLKVISNDKARNPNVRAKIIALSIGWREELDGMKGYESLSKLHKSLPSKIKKTKSARPKQRKEIDFMNDEADDSTPFETVDYSDGGSSSTTQSPSASGRNSPRIPRRVASSPATPKLKSNHQIDKEFRIPKINYTKERPKIQSLLADSSTSAINLKNALTSLPAGELSVENEKASLNFDKCRQIRRKVLRYLQLVDNEEFLGSLIHANEELVEGLQRYDQLSKSVERDSLSEYESDDASSIQQSNYTYESSGDEESIVEDMRNTRITKVESSNFPRNVRKPPPIPSKPKTLTSKKPVVIQDNDDDDNPFGDDNEFINATPRW